MLITPPYRPLPEWTSPQPTQAVDAYGSVVSLGGIDGRREMAVVEDNLSVNHGE